MFAGFHKIMACKNGKNSKSGGYLNSEILKIEEQGKIQNSGNKDAEFTRNRRLGLFGFKNRKAGSLVKKNSALKNYDPEPLDWSHPEDLHICKRPKAIAPWGGSCFPEVFPSKKQPVIMKKSFLFLGKICNFLS